MNGKLLFFVLYFSQFSFAQTAPNFTVTDTDGQVHKLYEDYLDKGKIVVLKIFFVNCPPCNSIAPSVQQKFVEWGSGMSNVQFIEATNKISDINSSVKGYKIKHGLTFPSISYDGGAIPLTEPYMNGTLGQWSGTPFFAVITPDKKLKYDVLFNNLSAVLRDAGGIMPSPSTSIKLNITTPNNVSPAGLTYILKNADGSGQSYNITELTGGSNEFTYPSTTFPVLANPVITIQSPMNANSSLLSVSDLVAIRHHILGTNKLQTENQKLAADVNGSNSISVADILAIQKVIVGTSTFFPNNVPSYKLIPAQIPLVINSTGGNVTVTGVLIKMGNVN